jgi:uncharacterized protein (TIGR02466 family)
MIQALFSTEIYWHTAQPWDRKCLSCVPHHSQLRCTPRAASDYAQPRMTSQWQHLDILSELELDPLAQYIDAHVHKFYPSSEPPIRRTRSWFNICSTGMGQQWHAHARSVISGTVYMQVPDGAIEFRSPNPYARLEQWPYQPTASRTPNDGDLVLWPSWLEHRVSDNTSDTLRISLSFDYA